MKFPKEFLQEIASLEKGEGTDAEDYQDMPVSGRIEVVSRECDGKSRWSVMYSQIFKAENRYWQTDFREGATEYQDESPYQDDDDQVECQEMEAYEMTVTAYRLLSNAPTTA